MKRNFTAVLLLLLFLFCTACAAEPEETPNSYREVSHTSEYLTDGVITGTDHYEYSYNDLGQLVLSIGYENGTETSRATLEYDEHGNMIRKVTVSEEGTSVLENKFTLDDHSRILRQESYTDGILTRIDEFTYDRQGNEISHSYTGKSAGHEDDVRHYTKTYDRKGNLTGQTLRWNFNNEYYIWEYENGLETKKTTYHADTDEVLEYWAKTYDESGFLTRESRHSADGTQGLRHEYIRDESGLVATRITYDAEGNPSNQTDIFTYDEYGNKLMQERCRDGQVYWRISSTYERIEPTES